MGTKIMAVDRHLFLKERWLSYQESMNNKHELARIHDVPEDCVIIGEPPLDDEIVCDVCNAECLGPSIFLNEESTMAYCKKCAKELVGL